MRVLFFLIGLSLGLAGVGGGVGLWLESERLRPEVEAVIAETERSVGDADRTYDNALTLLSRAQEVLNETPALTGQVSLVLVATERLGQTAVAVTNAVAADLRGISSALPRLLAPTLDLERTARQLEVVATDLRALLDEVKKVRERTDALTASSAAMHEALASVGRTLPKPADAPSKRIAVLLRDGRALQLYDAGRVVLSGLLLALGLSSLVGAFAHRRPSA